MSAPNELVESLRTRGKLNGGSPNPDLLREWMRSSGADIVKRTGGENNRWSLIQLDGVCEMLPEEAGKKSHAEALDTVSVEPVMRVLKPAEEAQGGLTAENPGHRLSFRGDGPFAFKTREGGRGVLQILESTDNPPSVKVRYKLVQPP